MIATPRRPSRAPVYVTAVFFAIAIGLVLFAMRGAAPPEVVIGRAGTPEAPREVAVIMRDYLFEPTPLLLVRGETVRFVILNGGLEAHEFVLGDAAVQAAWAAADAAATPAGPLATSPPASVPPEVGGLRVVLGSGEQTSVAWTIPDTSALSLVCHLPGHVEEGMVGRVEFREETPTRSTQSP